MNLIRKMPGLILAAALLTACADTQPPAATPETAAETAGWSVGEMRPLPEANDQGIYVFQYSAINQDNHYPYNLLCRVDFDSGEVSPVCRVPGCTHDSIDCLAYIDIQSIDTVIPEEDGSLLIYHKAESAETRQDFLHKAQLYLDNAEWKEAEYPGEAGRKYLEAAVESLQQPSYVDRISADGLTRERLVTLPEDLSPSLNCWDGQALYGSTWEGNLDIILENQGVRIGLDGQVDFFDLPDPYLTSIKSGWGQYLVLSHISSPVDIRTMYLYGNYDAYYLLQNQLERQCWLYDPVQGTTQKLEMPVGPVTNFVCVGDYIVYSVENNGNQTMSMYTYDLKTGENKLLLEGMSTVYIQTIPTTDRPGSYIWGYPGTESALVDLDTGTWWTATELMELAGLDTSRYSMVNVNGESGDGRLILTVYDNNSRKNIYVALRCPTPEDNSNLTQQSMEANGTLVEEEAEENAAS